MKFRDGLPKLYDLFLAGFRSLEAWVGQKFNISMSTIDEFLSSMSDNALSGSYDG